MTLRVGGKAVDDSITSSAPRLRLVGVERRQPVWSSMQRRATIHPRRAAAQLRRMSKPADRRLADEAATVRLFFIIFISVHGRQTPNFVLR